MPEVRDLIFHFRQIQKQVDVVKLMTQRGLIALVSTLFLVSLFFLIYETVGFNWAETLLASDGDQIEFTGDSGKTIRVVFASLILAFSFIMLIFGIIIVNSSNSQVSNIKEDMKS